MMHPSTPNKSSTTSTTTQNQPQHLFGPTSSASKAGTDGTRQRQPYRDDPSLPPRLESMTPGGCGPASVAIDVGEVGGDEKSKNLPLSNRLWNTACCCCSLCVGSAKRNGSLSYLRRSSQEGSLVDDDDADDGMYYEDSFNDLSWQCTVGTSESDGIWLNRADPAGTIMAVLVWVLMAYSALTMSFLAATGGIPSTAAMAYNILAALSLASHVKTSLTDPGGVPTAAVPTQEQRLSGQKLSMCSQCQTFKPPFSHHCRICNRCISRMDHHCPWMNNCVGAGNLKHFLLFLIYTWTCSVFCLSLLAWNYFFCADESCTFHVVLLQLVRIMSVLSVGTFLFTSSMLMNVVYGIMTGVGTIDRLKKKANGTLNECDEDPIPLHHVFGIGPVWQWCLPLDPIFHDYDVVMGYSTPQRLLREQMRDSSSGPMAGGGNTPSLIGSTFTRDSYGMAV